MKKLNFKEKQSLYKEHKNWINLVNQKEGWVKMYKNNDTLHEVTKFRVGMWMKKLGYDVWSEAEFRKPYSGRCDIFALKDNHVFIIEVLHSETYEEMIEKTKTYPMMPIAVHTSNFSEETFKL